MTKQRPKILAIDDNPENLVVLGAALRQDFDFQFASSGPTGIELAEASEPDLILLDVMMPEVDGFETCRRFKANPKLADIPIIFITAMSDMETEASGLGLGAADYIAKPFKSELVKLRVRNIIQLTRITKELKESEERLQLVMNATGEGIWDWRIGCDEVLHNAAWCEMLGLDQQQLTHPLDLFTQLIHPDDLQGVQEKLASAVKTGEIYVSEHRLRHAAGQYVWVADRGRVASRSSEGEPLRMVGSIKNIDERKQNEASIYQLAFYDPLTNLPNRRLLLDRLQQSMLKNKREKSFGAVMFLDLDRFKLLNDTHGHAMGDVLLIQVANRLQNCVRQQDTVARLGGDEFVVMLENLSKQEEEALKNASLVANKILQTLNKPYQLGELDYDSTPSLGLTLFSSMDTTLDEILKRADEAMYDAKAAGRNNLKIRMS